LRASGAFFVSAGFLGKGTKAMRACFLGQNVCALGYGVATLQTPPLHDANENTAPGQRPPYPLVIPSDGHEYGRPLLYPLTHPLRPL
jgi:hypothetical protein